MSKCKIIELKYDAFTIKTFFAIDGKEASLRCLGTGEGARLQEWVGDFFPELIKKCNLGPGSECAVQFYGTLSDYEDVANAYNEYQKSSDGIKINFPPCKRYPQSLSEIRKYVNKKIAENDKEISTQKAELENVNADLAKKANLEAEKTNANLDELEAKASGYGEMLKMVYKEERKNLKNDMKKIKQEAEYPKLSAASWVFGLSRDYFLRFQRECRALYKTLIKDISQYIEPFAGDKNEIFFDNSDGFFSAFSSLSIDPRIIRLAILPSYTIPAKDKKPWDVSRDVSRDGINISEKEAADKTSDAQKYFDSIIDDAERHCTVILDTIKQHYESKVTIAVVPIMKRIAERRENIKSSLDNCSSTSQDNLTLENAILQLEAKNECLVELSTVINRMQAE